MKKSLYVTFLLLCAFSVHSFGGVTYTGSLQVADGELEGTGFWVADNSEPAWFPANLSWSVTDNDDGTWSYTYNLDVYRADVSHFVIETSDSFGFANISNENFLIDDIMVHDASPGVEDQPNPFLPQDIYGPKFEIGDEAAPESEYTSISVSFDSDRDPIWGDFYAKCGKTGGPVNGTQNTLWNQGLLIDDPTAPAADGSLLNHVLIPDTIPEPATLVLLGLGSLLLRRRK